MITFRKQLILKMQIADIFISYSGKGSWGHSEILQYSDYYSEYSDYYTLHSVQYSVQYACYTFSKKHMSCFVSDVSFSKITHKSIHRLQTNESQGLHCSSIDWGAGIKISSAYLGELYYLIKQ